MLFRLKKIVAVFRRVLVFFLSVSEHGTSLPVRYLMKHPIRHQQVNKTSIAEENKRSGNLCTEIN
jgi:hypothetical protein